MRSWRRTGPKSKWKRRPSTGVQPHDLRRTNDRRKQHHALRVGTLEENGGDGAADAHQSCRTAMEYASIQLPRRKWIRRSCRIEPPGIVRFAGGGRFAIEAAYRNSSERSQTIHAHWQVQAASGHAIESQWHRAVWFGRAAARDALRGGRAAAGIWR